MSRVVTSTYRDPLDELWLGVAARLGLRVVRSAEVFAATDGKGTLTLGEASTLDADDCLGQMVFHELCHWLVQGPESFHQPDWGLDNLGDRDDEREHACLRAQAALTAPHGLRHLLGPTTDFRAHYDALPADPLEDTGEAVELARAAVQRAGQAPWHPHLQAGLRATRAIAEAVAPHAAPDSLWARFEG